MTFGEKLKEKRLEKGLTQAKVADDAKIARRTYISYEQDKTIPKRREVIEQLAKAVDCDVEELLPFIDVAATTALSGAAAGLAVLGSVLGTAALPLGPFVSGAALAALASSSAGKAIASSKKGHIQEGGENDPLTYSNDMLLQYEKKQSRFQAIAVGIIYSKLASDGISFQQGNKNEIDRLGGKPDEYIKILGDKESDWWLSFWAKDEQLDRSVIMSADDRAAVMIGRYATSKYDENRKVTIVVDDETLYDALLQYKDHNSYNGNMSVLLVDCESVSVVREAVIAKI